MKKLALVTVLAVTGGALWIEHGHRVVIDAPVAAELQTPAAAAACPDNDTMPYESRCIDYLKVAAQPAPRPQAVAVEREVRAAPCPDNDKVPYSASCIAFLKGVGRNWQGAEQPASIPAPQ